MHRGPAAFLMGIVLVAFCAYSLGGCPTPAPVTPTNPSDAASPFDGEAGSIPDAVMPGDDEDPAEASAAFPACARACAKLKALSCPEAARPDGGKTCYRVCADAEASGKFSLKPACVAAAQDRDAVLKCGSVRCRK